METYHLAHFPPNIGTVHVAYFENVTNAPEIRSRLVKAATTEGPEGEAARAAIDFGFVDASLVSAVMRWCTPWDNQQMLLLLSSPVLHLCRCHWVPHPPPNPFPSLTPQLVSKQHLTTGILTAVLTSLPQERSATLPEPPVPKTRSHNLHSELLMALSPNNNITDAIRKHGVGDTTTRLAVVRYGDDSLSQKQVWDMINDVVQGELTSVDELDAPGKPDWPRIDKVS